LNPVGPRGPQRFSTRPGFCSTQRFPGRVCQRVRESAEARPSGDSSVLRVLVLRSQSDLHQVGETSSSGRAASISCRSGLAVVQPRQRARGSGRASHNSSRSHSSSCSRFARGGPRSERSEAQRRRSLRRTAVDSGLFLTRRAGRSVRDREAPRRGLRARCVSHHPTTQSNRGHRVDDLETVPLQLAANAPGMSRPSPPPRAET
jgi:hypothetical protein